LAIDAARRPAEAAHATVRPRFALLSSERAALASVLLLAALLNLWGLVHEGFDNLYYAAAVRSALDSWHNLFFSAFDPGGYAATDKPPLGFAVQALFAKLFGFSNLALALPQALAGIGAVWLLYGIVRRYFGGLAALIAALALAVTPIAVATARNNTIDSQLVLVSLAAVWATLRATESGRLRWLLLAATLVGMAFLIKLAEALLIVPACALAYGCYAPEALKLRLAKLLLAGIVIAGVGGSWVLAAQIASGPDGPYVISGAGGGELSVIFGTNGLGRLLPGAIKTTEQLAVPLRRAPIVDYPALGAGGSSNEVGPPGPLRLLGRRMAGQISWFLPIAFIGLAIACWELAPRRRGCRKSVLSGPRAATLLFGVWLVSATVFFSLAGFVHRYYLVMLAPAIAGAAGIGLAALWQRFRREDRSWAATALPLTLLVATEVTALIAMPYDRYRALLPGVVAVCGLPAIILLLARYPTRHPLRTPSRRTQAMLAAIACCALFAGPTIWSFAPLIRGDQAELPFAGPDLSLVSRSAIYADGEPRDLDPGLAAFLRANHADEQYWLGAFSTVTAAPAVLALNRPVMALGGYVGGDATTDLARLQSHVRGGQVRFFLLPDVDGIRPQAGEGVPLGVAQAVDWVRGGCAQVPDALWRTRPDPAPSPQIGPYYTLISGGNLYDCAAVAG
jgi:4-amino-4-deoxy-L-arabinose transferase-like glycosyltransferase